MDNNYSFNQNNPEWKFKTSIPQQSGGDSFGSFMSSAGAAMGGVNPYIAGAQVLSHISEKKQKQEAERKANQMNALESYLGVAKQMGQGLYKGGVN